VISQDGEDKVPKPQPKPDVPAPVDCEGIEEESNVKIAMMSKAIATLKTKLSQANDKIEELESASGDGDSNGG